MNINKNIRFIVVAKYSLYMLGCGILNLIHLKINEIKVSLYTYNYNLYLLRR